MRNCSKRCPICWSPAQKRARVRAWCSHTQAELRWYFSNDANDDTSKPLARTGTVTGRLAFYDLLPDTHWGGFISGDEVTMTWDRECGCGREGPFVEKSIARYTEMRGGDDKISCAASTEAHEEAMDYLSEVHASAAA